jgi:hypothetical protein
MNKRILSTLTAVSLVICMAGATHTASADDATPLLPEISSEQFDEAAEELLEDEGFEDVEVIAEDDELIVQVETDQGTADSTQLDLVIDPDTVQTEFQITDTFDDEEISATFEAEIVTSTEERIVFTLTDPETGEIYSYDSDQPVESVAFVIPVAFAGIALATILKALAVGTAIVISGILLYEASKAIPKIYAKYNSERSQNRRSYYPATRMGNKAFVNGNGLTDSQARTRARANADVWSISAARAKTLANWVSSPARHHDAHFKGAMRHWHPKTTNAHCFYGFPT